MLILPKPYSNAEQYTHDLCDFIATPLVQQVTGGIHVNDALIYNAWEALPEEWTKWWSSWPDYRLAQQDLIDSTSDRNEEKANVSEHELSLLRGRPESLTRWLHTIKSLALDRHQRPGPRLDLPEALTARMKTKKMIEISQAAGYIHDVCLRNNISRVIDMGSGQGYLSVTLAYLFPQLRVLAIDGSQSQLAGSKAFAASLGVPETRLEHVQQWIDGSRALAVVMEGWARGEKCILVGLHACGSLSEHMLRYFSMVPCIEHLAAVGCCYNHIEPRTAGNPAGFPISSRLRERDVVLGSTALMTACQAPNNWDKQQTTSHERQSTFSRRRLYRAILEKLFHDRQVQTETTNRQTWGIRKGDLASFVKFTRRAMECLGIDSSEIPESEMVAYEERYASAEGQLAILGTLGVVCGKVVESVIVMDRFWFLDEQPGMEVDVFPMFDYEDSPRNLIVVGEKRPSTIEDH